MDSKKKTQISKRELIKRLLTWRAAKYFMTEMLWNIPILCIYLLAILYGFKAFVAPKNEAITLLNYSFGVIAALSGLCFTWASGLTSNSVKDKIQFAGERFFHSAVLLLVAILIRFLTDYPASIDHHNLLKGLFYKIIVFFSMTMAVTYFYTRLYITSKYLWRSRKRHTGAKFIPDPFSEIPETNKEEQNTQPLTNTTNNEN